MKKLGVFLLLLVFAQMVSSAHWISGWSEDALDGEGVDGKNVVMWNPLVGTGNNLTDVVGVTGNSGVSGVYMMDCEMLSNGCIVNDLLSLKIFGDRYVSWIVNVTISGAGYDAPENLSLNSPPSVDLISPINSGYSDSSVEFNCSFFDYDNNVARVSLWGNWSGVWDEEDFVTNGFENDYIIFNKSLTQGDYKWNCFVEDDLGIGSWNSSNNSFFVDTTSPDVWGVSSVTNVCGFGSIPVDCQASDNVEIGNVIIRSVSPGNILKNYSASFVSGNIYRANIDLDEVGNWKFECFGYDGVNNSNYSAGEFVKVGSGNPEISFVGGVSFEKNPEIEGEIINISVNASNSGCVNSGSFVVGFFDDGVSFENVTVSIGANSYLEVLGNWVANIGTSNISIYADLNSELIEDNESNNIVNSSVWLKSWQTIYGNVSLDIVLAGGDKKIGNWSGANSFVGNVFVADSEASVEWNNLQAIGRTKLGGISSGDFGEIDSKLGMSSFNDSINNLFSLSIVQNFSVFGSDIENVAYVNSSESGNFVTGILWDMSDSVDGEYDSIEAEDVVFVSKINIGGVGDYGIYDYEISVPSKLRSYDSGDKSKVYLYYDLG